MQRVGLVRYPGEVHAWILSLPGCITGAPDESALASRLPLAIADFLGWLRAHDEVASHDLEYTIVEDLDGAAFDSTGGEFCFEHDRQPLSGEELATSLRLLRHARSDLLAATRDLPAEVLDWAPPRAAFARFDAWAPEVRTIRDVTRHILELEVYYRCGLQDGPSKGIFEPVGDPLEEHRATAYRLRRAPLARVYQPIRPGRSTPEEWTVRKVVRRLISHERTHTAEIWQRRTWILLGTPTSP